MGPGLPMGTGPNQGGGKEVTLQRGSKSRGGSTPHLALGDAARSRNLGMQGAQGLRMMALDSDNAGSRFGISH